MLDFTSALYLGLHHPSNSLPGWSSLSLGRPAALEEPPGAAKVAAELAKLIGCEAGTLLPSTLHLFLDLFGVLARERIAIFMDQGSYPIVQWAAQRGAALGVPVHAFRKHDPAALQGLVLRHRDRKPVIVTDGFCPDCGPAPLKAYARIAGDHGGYLVLDDTQALGILGEAPTASNPAGRGGGGSVRWHGIEAPHLIVGASLAKAFGAPVAVLAGSRMLIRRFHEESETRDHSSPPSVPVIEAARRAVAINRVYGDALRRRSLRRVTAFREWVRQAGLAATGGWFPVQTLSVQPGISVRRLHKQLLGRGIRTVLRRGCNGDRPLLTFVISAAHSAADIRTAALAVRSLIAGPGARPTMGGVHEHV
jgi:8-amino-7-oxononanoate synthase